MWIVLLMLNDWFVQKWIAGTIRLLAADKTKLPLHGLINIHHYSPPIWLSKFLITDTIVTSFYSWEGSVHFKGALHKNIMICLEHKDRLFDCKLSALNIKLFWKYFLLQVQFTCMKVPSTLDVIGLGSSKGCRTLNIVGTSLEKKTSSISDIISYPGKKL